jgi:hypothetical protein
VAHVIILLSSVVVPGSTWNLRHVSFFISDLINGLSVELRFSVCVCVRNSVEMPEPFFPGVRRQIIVTSRVLFLARRKMKTLRQQ